MNRNEILVARLSFDNVPFDVKASSFKFGDSVSSGFQSLHAVQRGYFPLSSTGFRSLGLVNAMSVPPALEPLKPIAQAFAKERTFCLRDAARALRVTSTSSSLSHFITLDGAASRCIAQGLFAPDAERAALWSEAFRLLHAILHTPRFHPAPNHVWTEEFCAKALMDVEACFSVLKLWMQGTPPTLEQIGDFRYWLGASAYLELPPRPEGEPIIPLPAIGLDFGFDVPSKQPEAFEEDDDEFFEESGDEAPDEEDDDPEFLGDADELPCPAHAEASVPAPLTHTPPAPLTATLSPSTQLDLF